MHITCKPLGRTSAEFESMSPSFFPRRDVWYASDSPSSSFSAIFEDDGQTGYLYAYDRDTRERAVLDAVHVYNVDEASPHCRKTELIRRRRERQEVGLP